MAQRTAHELAHGVYVNLGVGLPTRVAHYIPDGVAVLQSENGLFGIGPFPPDDEVNADQINAGKQTPPRAPAPATSADVTPWR